MLEFPRSFRRSSCFAALWTVTSLSCGGGTTQATPPEEGGAGPIDPIDNPPVTCGSLDALAVARIAPANLERVLKGASRSLDFTNASLVLPKSLSGHSSSSPWDHKSLDSSIDDLLKSFREHLFVDANLETQAAGVVTYRLRSATMCGSSTSIAVPGVDGGTTSRPPSSCEKFFTEHELRLEVRRVSCDAGDNLHVDFVADPERHKVLAADWFENRIDVAVDVGESVRRLQAYGTFADDVVIDQASGRLTFGIDALPAGATTMRLGVPMAIDVQVHDNTSRIGVVAARSDNAFVVSADPVARRLHASIAVGGIDATMPLHDFVSSFFNRSSTAEGTDAVTLSIAGLDGDFDYDGSTDALSIHHLGLGDGTSRVTRAGTTLLAIDLNADANRHVDVNVTADSKRQLLLDIAPKVRLDLEYSMASVNPLVKNLEQFALDDTVSIQVDGAPALRLLETTVGTTTLMRGGTGWLLGMTTGHLAMTSRTVPVDNVEVAASKCLYRSPGPFTAQHEILRELSSRDCP